MSVLGFDFQTDVEEAMRDWDRRFLAWRVAHNVILQEDQYTPWNVLLSAMTVADYIRTCNR